MTTNTEKDILELLIVADNCRVATLMKSYCSLHYGINVKNGGKRMRKKYSRNNRVIILFLTIAICFTMAHFQGASAKQIENDNSFTLQEPPAQPSTQPKQKTDPFIMAIIGLSLGCMGYVSSIHWSMSQRRRLETDIQKLDTFLTSNCSVSLQIAGSKDNEPMLQAVRQLQENKVMELQTLQNDKESLIRTISDIEAKIMGVWG